MIYRILLTAITLILLNISHLAGQTEKFKPNVKPTLTIDRTEAVIKIDAVLDEVIWQQVKPATNFSEVNPGDNARPKVKTEVFLCYDDENLYMAVNCYDNPRSLRATLTDRDKIWQDDFIGIFLDTYGVGSWGYFLASNPYGVQADARISSTTGDDGNFDLVFKSAGEITDFGYVVEMAIPFSSIRFPYRNIQQWRINFWRSRPQKTLEEFSWTEIDRDNPCWFCQLGFLKGITGAKPGSNFDIIPSVVAGRSGEREDTDYPDSEYFQNDFRSEIGATLKWAITPSLTLEGTYNPDFSQVESDAAQLTVNQTFALLYPEKRPFFQEGSDLTQTWLMAVYTRSINDPLYAAKVIGRWDKATLYLLSALDQNTPVIVPFEEKSEFAGLGKSFANIGRFTYNYAEASKIGALFTDRRYSEGGHGTIGGFDISHLFWQNFRFEAQFLLSSTEEPNDTTLSEDFNGDIFGNGKYTADFDGEKFDGLSYYAGIKREARHFNFDLIYKVTSPTFRAANGFVAQNDRRDLLIDTKYIIYSESNWLERIIPSINIGKIYNYDNEWKDEWIGIGSFFRFKAQTEMAISLGFNNEKFKDIQFKDLHRIYLEINSNFSDSFRFGLFGKIGYFIGDRDEDIPVKSRGIEVLNFWATIKPYHKLLVTPTLIFAYAINDRTDEELYKGYIFRLRTDYQFTRELAFRLICQYNKFDQMFSVEPLLSYKINPFSVFYLGASTTQINYRGPDWIDYGEPGWKTANQLVFVKFQYLFNI